VNHDSPDQPNESLSRDTAELRRKEHAVKAGVTPVLSSAWWKANKDDGVPEDPLYGALKKYELAKATFEKDIETRPSDADSAYRTFKTRLQELSHAVEVTLGKCDKAAHKNDIAGLEKYKNAVIPHEVKEVDTVFGKFQQVHGQFDEMMEAVTGYIKALEPIATLSAHTVLECEAAAPEAEKALAEVTTAKVKSDVNAANHAQEKAMKAGAVIAKKHAALLAAIQNGPRHWPYDRSKVPPEHRNAALKLSDRRSVMEEQIKNNVKTVADLNQSTQALMSKTRALAIGTSDATEALVAALDRLVSRAFALARENDQPTREMVAAISNLQGDLSAYKKAGDANHKQIEKKKALENLRLTKVHKDTLKRALAKSRAEIRKSMPSNVNSGNPTFKPLLEKLEQATTLFDKDDVKLFESIRLLVRLEKETLALT
jgi:hypothetical protein